jgi:hypothetical protein
VVWPLRTPDLDPLGFYIMGHLKALVYVTPVNTEQELWQCAQNACQMVQRSLGVFEHIHCTRADQKYLGFIVGKRKHLQVS